ncbi:MAG: hypothetical protein LBU66_03090 [Treponema sp.]|jgi:hypothetical protein|nr:hypothetical protein [Treponema sp.]
MNRLKDILVVVICLSGAAISLNLFRLDLFQTIASQNMEPVGTVTAKNNNVQRRFADRVLWGRLFSESPVYVGDLIRVAELSSASLDIMENKIDLRENTLIRILLSSDKDNRIMLNIGPGNLDIDSGGGIALKLPGSRAEAAAQTVLSVASNEHGVEVLVHEGSAVVTTDDGQTFSVSSGEVFIQAAAFTEGEAVSNFIQELIEPQTTELEAEAQSEPVAVAASSAAPPVAAPRPAAPPPTVQRAAQRTQAPDQAQTQTQAPAEPSRGVFVPANNHRIRIEDLRGTRRIDFSWPTVSGANAYIFTLYFQEPNRRRQLVKTDPLETNTWTLDNLRLLEQGTFIWHIDAVNINRDGAIEQRGETAENRFIVDIPQPGRPQVGNIEIQND